MQQAYVRVRLLKAVPHTPLQPQSLKQFAFLRQIRIIREIFFLARTHHANTNIKTVWPYCEVLALKHKKRAHLK